MPRRRTPTRTPRRTRKQSIRKSSILRFKRKKSLKKPGLRLHPNYKPSPVLERLPNGQVVDISSYLSRRQKTPPKNPKRFYFF